MGVSVLLDNIVDTTAVFYRVWCIADDHVRCLTCGMDMDISEAKYRLKNPCCMRIDLLYSIERTLRDTPRESRNLLDTDDARVSDDEDIEFVIDPVEEDKCEKYNPVESESSPVERTSYDIDDHTLVCEEDPRTDEKCYKIEKMKHQDNPVTMECHEDLFIVL